MNKSKKRTKNKEYLSPSSGVKKKPLKKMKVKFTFQLENGRIVSNLDSRLKIMSDGGVSCLINTEKGWQAVKGKLKSIKLYEETVKKKVLKKK